MPSIGPSFFTLGVIMVTVIAAQTPTGMSLSDITTESNYQKSSMTNTIPELDLNKVTHSHPTATNSTSNITSGPTGNTMSINSTSTSTITPWTKQKGYESSEAPISTRSLTTRKPISTSKSTTSATTTKDKTPTHKPQTSGYDNVGIIILVVIILLAVGFGVACYLARRRGRRYSVDFNSRPDEANIPLSTIQPELPADTVPQNGLQTFQSTETNAKESQEPEAKPLVQEEQKAEADKSVVDPSAESAAPAPSADSSQDKPKEGSAVEPNVEEKTDDEGIVSNKTSVESLKETNENNSNNANVKDWKLTDIFWEVSLDSPV